MNRVRACLALRGLGRDPADAKKLGQIRKELLSEPEIGPRWDDPDVDGRVVEAARRVASQLGERLELEIEYVERRPPQYEPELDAALDALIEHLSADSAEQLLAVFAIDAPTMVYRHADISLGPVAKIVSEAEAAAGGWRPDQVAVRIRLSARGGRAARSGIERLREVLGAVYYAAIRNGQAPGLQPGAPGMLAPGTFVVGTGEPQPISAELLRGAGLALVDLRRLAGPGMEDVETALSGSPADFATRRIRGGLAWLQRGVDAISPAESVLAFGVALETIIGDSHSHDVMAVLNGRLPFLLLPHGDPIQRLDIINEARFLYDYRSKVAHGRVSREDDPHTELADVRRSFAAFVVRTLAGFLEQSREHQWQEEKTMKRWFDLEALR